MHVLLLQRHMPHAASTQCIDLNLRECIYLPSHQTQAVADVSLDK